MTGANVKVEDSSQQDATTGNGEDATANSGKRWFNDLTAPQATIIAALIAIIPTLAAYFVSPNLNPRVIDSSSVIEKKLSGLLGHTTGQISFVYPNLFLGLRIPTSWTAQDKAARLSGGDVQFVKRFNSDKSIIMGLQMNLQQVNTTYVTDPAAYYKNQLKTVVARDANGTMTDVSIGGRNAKKFDWDDQNVGKPARLRLYLVPIKPEVELRILAFAKIGESDYQEFWKETDAIISSIVFDEEAMKKKAESVGLIVD